MRIGIVGPGAMGTLFGCLLARSDGRAADVWLLCRRAADAARIEERGLLVERDGETLHARARATAQPRDAAPLDLLIVLVKAFATADAIATCAPALAPDGVVLTLQNGLGNDRTIEATVGAGRVLAGVTSQGATLLEPGHTCHNGAGSTVLADLAPPGAGEPTPRARRTAALLSRAGIATEAVADAAPVIWGKLVASSALNPLTALTGRRNGELLSEPSCLALAEDTARETARVAGAAGVPLPFADPA
ncbi:MAG: 2-dehydropantoate 2-reductase, partial [Chloroflexi bacterium]|nr:2-dehydropantoate 2-reductase [Chloroflexota bacterium]